MLFTPLASTSLLSKSSRFLSSLHVDAQVLSRATTAFETNCYTRSLTASRTAAPTIARSSRFYHTSTINMVQGVSIQDNCIVNVNPATGEVISRVPCTLESDVDKMVQQAHDAQKSWSALSIADRMKMLREGLQKLAAKSPQLTELIVKEMGKPYAEAQEEVEGATQKDDFLKIVEDAQQPQKFGSSVVVRQALGVVVILSPWNFPADEILLLALPALAAGNTVIVKPSEVTPETGAMVVNSLAEALPPNVIQLAQGDGAIGSVLVNHQGINMVAMTGSSATGKKILESAAPQLKRIVLELGGKDPMVVFEDASLEKAASDAVRWSLSNTGQVCCSTERIYVADSVSDKFEELVLQEAKSYKVGNGMDETVKVGPLVSKMQRNVVAKQVDSAVEQGAKLLHQSSVPTSSSDDTSFYPVTVLSEVTHDMDVFKSETFGPVVAISKFDGSEEEAVRLANNTEYGLGSSVYTSDLEKASRVANQISAGQVGINCYPLDKMDVKCPWVGHKNSGFGYHSGVDGFHQFSIPKSLVYDS